MPKPINLGTVVSVELLPCPFCGGEAMEIERYGFHEVCCLPCTAAVQAKTEAEAIAAWNTRPSQPPVMDVERVAFVENLVDELIETARATEWGSHFGAHWEDDKRRLADVRARAIAAMQSGDTK